MIKSDDYASVLAATGRGERIANLLLGVATCVGLVLAIISVPPGTLAGHPWWKPVAVLFAILLALFCVWNATRAFWKSDRLRTFSGDNKDAEISSHLKSKIRNSSDVLLVTRNLSWLDQNDPDVREWQQGIMQGQLTVISCDVRNPRQNGVCDRIPEAELLWVNREAPPLRISRYRKAGRTEFLIGAPSLDGKQHLILQVDERDPIVYKLAEAYIDALRDLAGSTYELKEDRR